MTDTASQTAINNESSVKPLIDNGPVSFGILTVIAICFVLNMLDGFDVVAMSVVAPSLSDSWGITPQEKGYILSAALIGMTIGAWLLAPLSDRFGRRPMILASAIVTGISLICTSLIENSVPLMVLTRIITGLGVGVILVSTPAITTEFTPERWRNFAVPVIVSGFPFGAMIVGPVANYLLPFHGWESLFLAGGVLTLLIGALGYMALPESLAHMATRQGREDYWLGRINKVLRRIGRDTLKQLPGKPESCTNASLSSSFSAIFASKYRTDTLCMLASFFLSFLTLYFMFSWIPSLFINSGETREAGIRALTLFNIGAVLGIYAIGLIATRTRLAPPICLFYLIAAACMLYSVFSRASGLSLLNALIFVTGFTLQGAFTGMYAIVSRIYNVSERATGIGFSIGFGRIGAILSPVIAGYFVALGWTMYPLFALFAVPLFAVAILMVRIKV